MITKEMLENEFYDVRGVADKMGKSVRQINTLASEGRFEGAFKIWQGWLIPKSAVENFVYKQRGFPKGTHTRAARTKKEVDDWLTRAGYAAEGTTGEAESRSED